MLLDACDVGGNIQHETALCSASSNLPGCAIVLHPCCYGIYGGCTLTTRGHCDALMGIYNENEEVCNENECLFEECGMGYKYNHKNYFGYLHPNQFYRFVTATFLHVGVIHFVMNALGQYPMVAQVSSPLLDDCSSFVIFSDFLLTQIEFVAGLWRTAVMYIFSGIGGFMFSALFSSGNLSNGSSAAIYGMLGVETVSPHSS